MKNRYEVHVRNLSGTLVSLVFVFLCATASAQTKVVVVPMSGDDSKPLANVITVAKGNGDFSSVFDATNAITDSSPTNPYIVVVAPGVYTETNQISVPGYVTLSGSGPDITVIESKASFTSPTDGSAGSISLSDYTRLQDLTIRVNGTGSNSKVGIGTKSNSNTVKVDNVHVEIKDSGFSENKYAMTINVGDIYVTNSQFVIDTGAGLEIGIQGTLLDSEVFIGNSFFRGTAEADVVSGGALDSYCSFVFWEGDPLGLTCDQL